MKNTFVETSNYRRFLDALTRVDDRGALESCIVVVDGKPGLGKTKTMDRWQSLTGSVYLRAQKWWEWSDFTYALLAEIGVKNPPRGRTKRFEAIIERLDTMAGDAIAEDRQFSLVLDEVDGISTKAEIMETIRGISDLKYIPTILVGMGTLRDNLRRFPQIESRAPNKVAFVPLDLAEATSLISGLCEVPVAPDLVQFVWKVSRGFSRELVDAIKRIESFGLRLDLDGSAVTMADMAGQVVMSNRDTGKMILVPEAA